MTIEENKALAQLHTFHLEVRARYFVEVTTVNELKALLESEVFKNNSRLILGGGSNVLFTKDFEGLVVKVALQGIHVEKETDAEVVVKVGAGMVWNDLVLHAVGKGWGGIENLSLIPGTVGAAPMQNIGAYGVEIKDVFVSLEALEISTGRLVTFSKEACDFGYRESVFKTSARDKYVITSVELVLSKNPTVNTSYGAINDTLSEWGVSKPTIADVSRAVVHIRQSKLPDPSEIGNAGSFFKNPTISAGQFESLRAQFPDIPGYPQEGGEVKVPAGWLIEKDGWKGKTLGAIGVHKKQALVLVNYGGGSGKELWQLAGDIRSSVKARFGIELTPEVNVI